MTEARFAAELILGRALNELDNPTVGVVQFSEHLGERKAFLPLWLDPCGAMPFTPLNLERIRCGIHQDYISGVTRPETSRCSW